MAIIRMLFIILEAATCLALIGLILLQKSKDGGLGMSFGSGGNDSLFGARAGNVLTRATVIIGILFMVNTLVLGMMFAGSTDKSLIEEASVMQPIQVEKPVEMAVPAMPAASGIPVEMAVPAE